MPFLRTALSGLATSLLLLPMAIPAGAQSASNASVIVASVEDGSIMGANSIDDMIAANLVGRIALAILVQAWMDDTQTPGDTLLEGGDGDLTLETARDHLLEDGRRGEMARALVAARIGYTPLLLDAAVEDLFAQAGVTSRGLDVQRGGWGGPEWTGAVSARDTARLGIALARMESFGQGPILAGSGNQCIGIQMGERTQSRWVAVVSGAVSPQGCLAAAQSSIGLTDTRVAEAERIDPTSDKPAVTDAGATQGLGLPDAR